MIEPSPAASAPIRWQSATITRIAPQTARIKSFFLLPSAPFTFAAGQHVDIRLTAPDGYRAIRSYSIASASMKEGGIELAIERLDDGEVSPFFHEIATTGDEIELRGPLGGHFVWQVDDGGPLLLVGGGSGLVPLMAMIRHRRAANSDVPTLLLLSARAWNDILYRDELLAMERETTGFHLAFALTREPAPRQADFSRRVDQKMMSEVLGRLPARPRYAFLCGSNMFVNAAADGAVAAGLPPSLIRTERYGG
jgi:ferredoxin-NADP reductase